MTPGCLVKCEIWQGQGQGKGCECTARQGKWAKVSWTKRAAHSPSNYRDVARWWGDAGLCKLEGAMRMVMQGREWAIFAMLMPCACASCANLSGGVQGYEGALGVTNGVAAWGF